MRATLEKARSVLHWAFTRRPTLRTDAAPARFLLPLRPGVTHHAPGLFHRDLNDGRKAGILKSSAVPPR